MTTLEQTISLIKNLPETNLLEIQKYARKTLRQEKYSPAPEATVENILATVKISHEQIKNGEYREASEVMCELKQKYGLHS